MSAAHLTSTGCRISTTTRWFDFIIMCSTIYPVGYNSSIFFSFEILYVFWFFDFFHFRSSDKRLVPHTITCTWNQHLNRLFVLYPVMGPEAHAAQETISIKEYSSLLQFLTSSSQFLAVLRRPGRSLAAKIQLEMPIRRLFELTGSTQGILSISFIRSTFSFLSTFVQFSATTLTDLII